MFKNMIGYRANNAETSLFFKDIQTRLLLENLLPHHLSRHPAPTQWRCFGLAHTALYDAAPVFIAGNAAILRIDLHERVLPRNVIQHAVLDRAQVVKDLDGRDPGRQQYAQIRDEVLNELLPAAFVKHTRSVHVIFYKEWMLVDAGSAKLADDVFEWLSELFAHVSGNNSFSVRTYVGAVDADKTSEWLGAIVNNTTLADEQFKAVDSVVLKKDSVVRFKGIDLPDAVVDAYLQEGLKVKEARLLWYAPGKDDAPSLDTTLTNNLWAKRLVYSDILLQDEREDGEDSDPKAVFAAQVILSASWLHDLAESLQAFADSTKTDNKTDTGAYSLAESLQAFADSTKTDTGAYSDEL